MGLGSLAALIFFQSFGLFVVGLVSPVAQAESMAWRNVIIGTVVSALILGGSIALAVVHHIREKRFLQLLKQSDKRELDQFVESDAAKNWVSQPNAGVGFGAKLDFHLWARFFLHDRMAEVDKAGQSLRNAVEAAKKNVPLWRKICGWFLGVFLLVWSFGFVSYVSRYPELFNDPYWGRKLPWMLIGPLILGIIYWTVVAVADSISELKRLSPFVQKLSPEAVVIARLIPVSGAAIYRTASWLAKRGDASMQRAMKLVQDEIATWQSNENKPAR